MRAKMSQPVSLLPWHSKLSLSWAFALALSSGIVFTHQCMVHPFSVSHFLTTRVTFYPIALLFFSSHWSTLTIILFLYLDHELLKGWILLVFYIALLQCLEQYLAKKKKKAAAQGMNKWWMNEWVSESLGRRRLLFQAWDTVVPMLLTVPNTSGPGLALFCSVVLTTFWLTLLFVYYLCFPLECRLHGERDFCYFL